MCTTTKTQSSRFFWLHRHHQTFNANSKDQQIMCCLVCKGISLFTSDRFVVGFKYQRCNSSLRGAAFGFVLFPLSMVLWKLFCCGIQKTAGSHGFYCVLFRPLHQMVIPSNITNTNPSQEPNSNGKECLYWEVTNHSEILPFFSFFLHRGKGDQ